MVRAPAPEPRDEFKAARESIPDYGPGRVCWPGRGASSDEGAYVALGTASAGTETTFHDATGFTCLTVSLHLDILHIARKPPCAHDRAFAAFRRLRRSACLTVFFEPSPNLIDGTLPQSRRTPAFARSGAGDQRGTMPPKGANNCEC